MKVIITEKPSVAKDIAKVLKISSKKEGYFDSDSIQITWAFGHLIQLVDPDKYNDTLKNWSFDTLPIIPDAFQTEVGQDSGVQTQYRIIENLLKQDSLSEVICATDAGREGELIFRYIYQKAQCKAPIKRLWISSQTDKAISDGFKNLKEGDDYVPLFHSAICRSEADWLIGMNATRAYSIGYSYGSGVMSVGRVQTPVLKLIVDRHREYSQFVPDSFFEIFADCVHPNGPFKAKWFFEKSDRLTDREQAGSLHRKIQKASTGEIASTTHKSKKEVPPLLYDLTELQKDANRKFKFSAEETLKIMQALYEQHKLLTYPRTSSRYLSKDIEPTLPDLLEKCGTLADYKHLVDPLVEKETPKIHQKLINDKKVTDHHAIIPTDKKPSLEALSENEKKIYDLVVKRFIANFYPPCEKALSEICVDIAAERFKASGTIIKKQGWRTVYQDDEPDTPKKGKKETAETLLPDVKKGDTVEIKGTKLNEGKTKAPQLYTEASILAAMETAGKSIEDDELRDAMKDCGLGTPATRAQIIERLLKVNYINRDKNKLIPTEKGIKLISVIQDEDLLSAELTGEWEKKLNDMAQNQFNRGDYMNQIKEFTKRIIQNVKNQQSLKDNLGKCPKCSAAVVETKLAYSCSTWKEKGCTFTIWKTIAGRAISLEETQKLLKGEKIAPTDGFKTKEGKPFKAGLQLVDDQVKLNYPQEKVGDCPLCGNDIVETPKAYSCSSWRETQCKMVIWKNIAQRPISKEEASQLLTDKKTPVLKGFKSKQGKDFETKLVLASGKVQFDFS